MTRTLPCKVNYVRSVNGILYSGRTGPLCCLVDGGIYIAFERHQGAPQEHKKE